MTREEIIRGLECCTSPSPSYCRQCPYKGSPDDYPHCVHNRLQSDALALLKAREPKPPVIKENAYGWKFYYCPSCGKEFYQNNKFSFCEKCGQAVKWE